VTDSVTVQISGRVLANDHMSQDNADEQLSGQAAGPQGDQGISGAEQRVWMKEVREELAKAREENAVLQEKTDRQARVIEAKAQQADADLKKAERERTRLARDAGARSDQLGVFNQMDVLEDIDIKLAELHELMTQPDAIIAFSKEGIEKSKKGESLTAGDLIEQPIAACGKGKLLITCLEGARQVGTERRSDLMIVAEAPNSKIGYAALKEMHQKSRRSGLRVGGAEALVLAIKADEKATSDKEKEKEKKDKEKKEKEEKGGKGEASKRRKQWGQGAYSGGYQHGAYQGGYQQGGYQQASVPVMGNQPPAASAASGMPGGWGGSQTRPPMQCYSCGVVGHKAMNCPLRVQGPGP
jgi:hypothetical protein